MYAHEGMPVIVHWHPGLRQTFVIHLNQWAHTRLGPLAFVNEAEMGLHSDLSSFLSSTFFFFFFLFPVLLWTRPFSQVYRAALMSLTGSGS